MNRQFILENGFIFNTLTCNDGEIFGSMTKDGVVIESGFYRTKDAENACCNAILNQGYTYSDAYRMIKKSKKVA